jgi:hypothetical protein
VVAREQTGAEAEELDCRVDHLSPSTASARSPAARTRAFPARLRAGHDLPRGQHGRDIVGLVDLELVDVERSCELGLVDLELLDVEFFWWNSTEWNTPSDAGFDLWG